MYLKVRADKSDSSGERHNVSMTLHVMFVMQLLLVVSFLNDVNLLGLPKSR